MYKWKKFGTERLATSLIGGLYRGDVKKETKGWVGTIFVCGRPEAQKSLGEMSKEEAMTYVEKTINDFIDELLHIKEGKREIE